LLLARLNIIEAGIDVRYVGGAALLVVASAAVLVGAANERARVGPLARAPAAYFAFRCASCHGPSGRYFDWENSGPSSDAALRRTVASECSDKAGAPLAGTALDAEIAYVRSLYAGHAFLDWTYSGGGKLGGEVTNGASVTASFVGKAVPVSYSNGHWSLALPKGAAASDLVIYAMANGKRAVLRLDREAVTDGAWLPDSAF